MSAAPKHEPAATPKRLLRTTANASSERVPEPRASVVRLRAPRTRAECASVPRPCPHACRYRLDAVFEGTNCALDIADGGPATLDEVGAALGVTGERVRQIEEQALEKVLAVAEFGGIDGFEALKAHAEELRRNEAPRADGLDRHPALARVADAIRREGGRATTSRIAAAVGAEGRSGQRALSRNLAGLMLAGVARRVERGVYELTGAVADRIHDRLMGFDFDRPEAGDE